MYFINTEILGELDHLKKQNKLGGINMRLEGKVAIITGSASGIGRGMALALAKEGAHIVIVDINEEMGQKTLAEINQHNEGMLLIADISKKKM